MTNLFLKIKLQVLKVKIYINYSFIQILLYNSQKENRRNVQIC